MTSFLPLPTGHRKLLLLLLALACANLIALSQESPLYMVSGATSANELDTNLVYQAGSRLREWVHLQPRDIALEVVGETVRTTPYLSGIGSEFDLLGNPTGRSFPNAPDVYDGASDGRHIYGWRWFSAELVRFDLNRSNPVTLFTLPAGRFSKGYMGITFDPLTHSVWLAPWGLNGNEGHLANYSLDGRLIGTIALSDPQAAGAGLAMDYADNTLWFFNWRGNRYEQYSRAGQLLSTLTGMTRIYGAEFDATAAPVGGRVVAWGDNSFNQTNVPTGLSNPVAVSAGWGHSLALTQDGTVLAWGAGSTNASVEPEFGQAIVPAVLSSVVSIAAGTFHSLALREDGSVVAWGGSHPEQTDVPTSADSASPSMPTTPSVTPTAAAPCDASTRMAPGPSSPAASSPRSI